MSRKWFGVGVSTTLLSAAWVGCGGSEATSAGPADSGVETPVDTGGPTDSGSAAAPKSDGAVEAPDVTITFGTCPTFTPCGGDEKGTWKVSGGCLSDEVLATAKKGCPGLTTSNEVIKAKGIVTADGTNVTRQTLVTLEAKAHVPQTCADQAGGNCNLVAVGAQAQLGFDKATCVAADGGDGCDCDVEESLQDVGNDTYTKNGNTLTTSTGTSYDYCVAGSKLTYTRTDLTYPLQLELTK